MHNCKIPFDEIEASKPSNKQLREALFQVACTMLFRFLYTLVDNGGRAEFPALFIMRKNRFIQFVGNWDRIQNILDNDSTPEEVLQQAPDMYTFYRFFRNM